MTTKDLEVAGYLKFETDAEVNDSDYTFQRDLLDDELNVIASVNIYCWLEIDADDVFTKEITLYLREKFFVVATPLDNIAELERAALEIYSRLLCSPFPAAANIGDG